VKQPTDTEGEENGDTNVELESGRTWPFTKYKYELRIESDAKGVEKRHQRGEGV
jgi:hypothetical protein